MTALRPIHLTPIPARHIAEHARLVDECERLLDDLSGLRAGAPAEGVLLVLARRAMADVARLVSRDPMGRAIKRLPPGAALPPLALRDALADAGRALDAFRRAHGWNDEETGESFWLTHEEVASWGD